LTLSGEASPDERPRTNDERPRPSTPQPSSSVLRPSSARVDLAHEALIAGWPTLRQWLEEDRAGLLLHRRLAQAAGEWRSRGNDPSFLYGGSLLAEAQRYAAQHTQDLGHDELDFLGASVEREAARVRSRYLGQAAGGAIGAGLGYGLMIVLSSWFAHPGSLSVLPLAFLSMVPFGGLVGFGLGIGLWLGRSDQARRAVATALIGALLSGLVFPAYLLVATLGYFGPLDVASGALIGAGVGLGAGLPTSARRRLLGTTLGGALAAGLIVAIGGQLGTLLATIIGGPLVGILTGLGILATAVEQDTFAP
ncbi:MAG TPA: hypothetical protein VGJ87_06500, partial [Roseiflexaceae bacterium]